MKRTKRTQVENCYPTSKAVDGSGLTKTMVDYLCRQEIVQPSRSKRCSKRGHRRQYTFEDIVFLRTIKKILDQGISVVKIKRALKRLRKSDCQISRDKCPYKYLVSDGKDIYLRKPGTPLEKLTAKGRQLAFLFMVDIEQVHTETKAGVEALRSKSTKTRTNIFKQKIRAR